MTKLLETLSGVASGGTGSPPLEKLEYFPRGKAVTSHCPLLWASLVGLLPSSCSYRPSRGLNCPSKE